MLFIPTLEIRLKNGLSAKVIGRPTRNFMILMKGVFSDITEVDKVYDLDGYEYVVTDSPQLVDKGLLIETVIPVVLFYDQKVISPEESLNVIPCVDMVMLEDIKIRKGEGFYALSATSVYTPRYRFDAVSAVIGAYTYMYRCEKQESAQEPETKMDPFALQCVEEAETIIPLDYFEFEERIPFDPTLEYMVKYEVSVR